MRYPVLVRLGIYSLYLASSKIDKKNKNLKNPRIV